MDLLPACGSGELQKEGMILKKHDSSKFTLEELVGFSNKTMILIKTNFSKDKAGKH